MIKIPCLNELPCLNKACMTIGTYDGLHIGHRQIIENMVKYAKENQIPSILLTFNQHPLSLFDLNFKPQYIGTTEIRLNYFSEIEIDYLLMIDFSLKIANITHKSFIDILLNKISSLYLYLGYNFHFGRNNEGTIQYLKDREIKENGKLKTKIFEPIKYKEHILSSSMIRDLIRKGEMEKVKELLKRPYQITENVIEGQQKGREIQFPTINQRITDQVIPKAGVYKTEVAINGKKYHSMTFIGRKSADLDITNRRDFLMETNIFDFNENLYGKKVSILFEKYIRDNKRLNSFDELIIQLQEDKNKCKELITEGEN